MVLLYAQLATAAYACPLIAAPATVTFVSSTPTSNSGFAVPLLNVQVMPPGANW